MPRSIATVRIVLTLALATACLATRAVCAEAEPLAITTGPYLQVAAGDSMSVMWMTNRNSTGWVEYSPEGGAPQKAKPSHHGLIDANQRIHKATLSGLKPGTRYSYRVFSQDIVHFGAYKMQFGETVSSPAAGFRTASPRSDSVSFLVFNDIHEVRDVMPRMMEAAGAKPYDLVVWNGDILSHIERESQITGLLDDAVRLFASRVPLVWVRGNHETRGSFARQLPAYVALPRDRFYYSFDFGPLHIVVLDTGEDKQDGHAEYSGLVDFDAYRREQAAWLAEEVKTEAFRNAPFRVVLAHMPFPEGARPNHGMSHGWQQFGALLNGKVDLMVSAHMHRPAVVQPEDGRFTFPIVRGGGQTEQNRTVIRIDADRRRLRADIIRPGGVAAGSVEVNAKR